MTSLALVGCGRRPGLNFDCRWVPDSPFAADLGSEADVRHMLEDIQTAEELEIRYRDRVSGYRLVEAFGIVSRHGRDLAASVRPADREAIQRCLDTLLDDVAAVHSLTRSDIESLRPRLLHRGLDLSVTVPVVAFILLGLAQFNRWLRQRFGPDEWFACIAASLAGALVIPAMVLGVGWLWAMAVEIIRVGNEHVGHRGRTASLFANFVVLFGVGTALSVATSVLTACRGGFSGRP